MSADVRTTSTLDLTNLERQITAAERKVLRRFQSDALGLITDRWTGWRYRNRPDGAPRNVSLARWKGQTQVFDVAQVGVIITNDARSYDTGESYVALVERRRGAGSEAVKVLAEVEAKLWPATEEALIWEIAKNLKPGKPKSLAGRTAGTFARTQAAGQVL